MTTTRMENLSTKLILLFFFLSGCASTPDTGSLLCTKRQLRMYDRAGMEEFACDRDKAIFADLAQPQTWKQLNEAFEEFARPRLKKIAKRRRQQEASAK